MQKETIIIATVKSWNISRAVQLRASLSRTHEVHVVTDREALRHEALKALSPRYIFFPHWSWIIPEEIHKDFECVVFHTADLPYGRGGSPLQNLILRKIYRTKVSALRVAEGIDTGDIYLKKDVDLSLGSAEELLQRVSDVVFFEMIPCIIESKPTPIPQAGEVFSFARRTPEESNLSALVPDSLVDVYDFIRMLDGEGYPRAFLDLGGFRVSFSEVNRRGGRLTGRFEINENE
jgi:methionyl-tRNA formyltransferase